MADFDIKDKVTLGKDFDAQIVASSTGTAIEITRDGDHALRFYIPDAAAVTQTDTVSGISAATGVTKLPLSIGDGEVLEVGKVGIPVAEAMTTGRVCTSWLSSNAPGDWTLRLFKRTAPSGFSEVATFTVTTAQD